MSNQKERPPAEVNLSVSYEDGGQSLLNKTDVEILAVEDAYHARLDRKGSGRMSASYLGSHGGGGGGGGGAGSNEEKKDSGAVTVGGDSALQRQQQQRTHHLTSPRTAHPFSRSPAAQSDVGGRGDIAQRRFSSDAATSVAAAIGDVTPATGEVPYRSQMDLILSSGRRSGGKRGSSRRSSTFGSTGAAAPGGHAASPRELEDKERSKRFAEERRMKMDFQRGDSELGHPVDVGGVVAPPPVGAGIPRDISIASSSIVSAGSSGTTGLDGPSAPTLLMQNPEHMAAAAGVHTGMTRGRSIGSGSKSSHGALSGVTASALQEDDEKEGAGAEEGGVAVEAVAAQAAAPEADEEAPDVQSPVSAAAATTVSALSPEVEGFQAFSTQLGDSARDLVADLPFQRNSSLSPSAAVDLSGRSAPLLSQGELMLGRETSVATAATTASRSDMDDQDSDIDEIYASARTDSGVLCKIRRINLLIDQVESARFPFKKKLILANMNLTSSDLPVDDICSQSICQSMNKLSLAGNRLGHVPDKIVMELTGLRTLDLSQCDLRTLPEDWSLPHLKRLDLSHNRLVDFPDEGILKGLPELQHLDMYGNKVTEISLPHDCQVLMKLDHLNMGYNNLQFLPDDLNILTSLRTLKIMNNVIEKIPEQVCEMDLRVIDVSSNPLIQPPVETCERGICSMRRYYHCLKLEEKSRQRMLDEIHRKSEAKKQRKDKTKAKMKKKKEATFAVFGLSGLGKSKSVRYDEEVSEHTSSQLSSSPPSSLTGDKRSVSAPRIALARSAPSHGFLTSKSLKPTTETGPSLRSKTLGSTMDSQNALQARQKKLSLDGPIEKKVFAIEKVTARTPSDAVEVDEARMRDVEVVGKGQEQDYSKPGQSSFMSLASDSQDMAETLAAELELEKSLPTDTINDTLKVIFVGMAMTGKTSIIKRLLEGRNAVIPKREERTIGVDIYNWDPKNDGNPDRDHIDTSIKIEDKLVERTNGDVDIKFSLWDFAGQHVYHATHELFFSPRALYILVWDMGINNSETHKRKRHSECSQGAFKLSYDSSDDEEDPLDNDESKQADRALERDIDEKVQFWVDCIQSSAPGAAILPVASFDDYFDDVMGWGVTEAKRRCGIMRDRLLKHEEKRVQGLQERLEAYERGHRANSEAALRLRKLLCPFCRPKLIFGSDGSVVRVSGAKYTGFDRLSEKLVNIATGRDLAGWDYPIFRGHVGARIPRMRLEVRDVVREMRDRFKVVEWGFFIKTLREKGLHNVEDVSDALHFLTNIGELSYFGDVIKDFGSSSKTTSRNTSIKEEAEDVDDDDSVDSMPRCPDPEQALRESSRSLVPEDEDYDDEEAYVFPMDRMASDQAADEDRSVSMTASMSTASVESLASGLSQFIFLNPRWLVAAVACILRHDLSREINETRRLLNKKQLVGWESNTLDGDNFYVAHLNCPVVTAEDACMLWQAKKIINKAAERALQYSNSMTMSPFDFLQRLLIRFRVLIPIDLDIEKAMLGGKEYGRSGEVIEVDETTSVELNAMTEDDARFFFLPSLLGPGEPSEVWSYKNSDSWKTTIAHSILFPDGVPPGLMERITATVLSDIYSVTQNSGSTRDLNGRTDASVVPKQTGQSQPPPADGGQLFVKEILCWRSSFYLKLGMEVQDPVDGEVKESVVEIFCALLDKDSHLCVSSDFMGVGTRRLVLSGKGQVGEGGRKIWRGGYTLVIRAIGRVMEEYGGLEFEKQGICPECLAKRPVSRASLWDWSLIRSAANNGDETMRCQIGHRVDTRIITGMCSLPQQAKRMPLTREKSDRRVAGADHIIPVTDLLRGVVVVGLWDGKTDKIVRVGSGFVVDKKRGLIVTASHTLMNIWGDSRSPYGENYYGLRSAKVVIGVIPRERSSESIDSTTAVFRYFATIVAKDENIDSNGVCYMDACVLRITTRLEQDVSGNGDGCAEQPEILLVNTEAFKKERLHQLKVSNREAELEEQVRILGYNQGGEGLVRKGMGVNRVADFARGYVCMKFHTDVEEGWAKSRRFKPKEEIVVMCPTIGGHSGGPCVNQSGEVIGILSRADPTDRQRCYLVPAKAWRGLVKQAKQQSPYI